MTRIASIAVAVALILSACAAPQPVTGRADNSMLRFSAQDYTRAWESTR